MFRKTCGIFAVLLTITFLISACSQAPSVAEAPSEAPAPTEALTEAQAPAEAPTEAPAPTEVPDEPVMLQPEESVLDHILERGKVIAGVKYDFKPFGFVDEAGQVTGFDVDLARQFAKRWLGDENAIDLVQVTSKSRIPMLLNGQVDFVAASMTHNKERDLVIDYTTTYFMDGQSLLVRAGSGINSVADLDGKKVTAIQGSTPIDNIQAEADRLGIEIEIIPFAEYPPAIEALKAGQVDTLTTDSVFLSQAALDNPGLVMVGGVFTKEPYGMGVLPGDHRMRDLINFTLQDMYNDGTYQELYEKWFGPPAYQVEVWPLPNPGIEAILGDQ